MKYAIVLCGNKGRGKSTFAAKEWSSYLHIEYDNLAIINTYSLLEQTLDIINNQQYLSYEKILADFINILVGREGIVIDNSEQADEASLKLLVNLAKQYKKNMVFIFDVPFQKLYKIKSFSKLIDWDLINCNEINNDYTVEITELKNFISKNFSYIPVSDYNKIINLTKNNFNEIKRLMWIIKSKGNQDKPLSNEIINEYLKNQLEELTYISPELYDILKKSSVIGEIFEKKPLEDKTGFNILGITNYLEEIEELDVYIAKYFAKKDTFKFLSNGIYNAIISSVSASQKKEWHQILEKYYIQSFEYANSRSEEMEFLINAKRSAIQINDFQTIFKLNQVLLFKYLNFNDYSKSILIIDEILNDSLIKNKISYRNYLLSKKMTLLIEMGEYNKALSIVKSFLSDEHYKGSMDYLKYYYIKCLYNIGDIDKAYYEIKELINNIKITSKEGNNQKIFPLVYSMMSTIQNHLNFDDNGLYYYKLALNYSYNLFDDKTLYYEILSKCDMFYSNINAYPKLTECANYFKNTGEGLKAAKVYLNLATEMMFNGYGSENTIFEYLCFSKKAFIIPDDNLAYVKNNLAIYYILKKNDFISAINELESALFVNLSDFTNMTLFLNLSMCYYKTNGKDNNEFKQSYEQFQKYESIVESRKNRTKYEVIYRLICDLIFEEHSEGEINNICETYSNLSDGYNFFLPVFDIIRKKHINTEEGIYKNDSFFYKQIKDRGIFLAELRFWE